MKEFYEVRLKYYGKRKDYMVGMLGAEALRLSNQARFIIEICEKKLIVDNKKKKVLFQELQRRGYDPDPVNVSIVYPGRLQYTLLSFTLCRFILCVLKLRKLGNI